MLDRWHYIGGTNFLVQEGPRPDAICQLLEGKSSKMVGEGMSEGRGGKEEEKWDEEKRGESK